MRSTCSFTCFILHLPIVFVKSIQLLFSDFQRYAYDRNLDGHFIIDIRTKADSIDWVRKELYIRQQETGYPVQASSYWNASFDARDGFVFERVNYMQNEVRTAPQMVREYKIGNTA